MSLHSVITPSYFIDKMNAAGKSRGVTSTKKGKKKWKKGWKAGA